MRNTKQQHKQKETQRTPTQMGNNVTSKQIKLNKEQIMTTTKPKKGVTDEQIQTQKIIGRTKGTQTNHQHKLKNQKQNKYKANKNN